MGGGNRAEGNKGEKKWDTCNSIINKIYFKKKKVPTITVELSISPFSSACFCFMYFRALLLGDMSVIVINS